MMTPENKKLVRLWLLDTRKKINGNGPYVVSITADEHNALAGLFQRAEEVEQALEWAVAEIEGVTNYAFEGQKEAALDACHAILAEGE